MWNRWIPLALAVAATVWCAWAGITIWNKPIVYLVSEASTDPAVPLTEPPSEEVRSFVDVSSLRAIPLLIPLGLACAAVVAAWLRRPRMLLLFAVLLLGYSFVTGFSIGNAYWPPALLLVGTGVLALILRGLEGRATSQPG